MSFKIDVFDADTYADRSAQAIADALPGGGSLILTGGTTAEVIYPRLAVLKSDWSSVEFGFSDERCVPPDHAESNYGMARRLLLDASDATAVHRMKGELDPEQGAADYSDEIAPLVRTGFDLLLLGMGADHHIGAMFPGSPALEATRFCAAVDRPDGMQGLTLTPPAMLSARKVLLLVTGSKKAEAVGNVVNSDMPVTECPARLLAGHPDVTFLLDEDAAAAL